MPKKGLSWSSKKDPSTYSLVDEEEDYEVEKRQGNGDEYDEGEGENEGDLEGKDDEDEDESDGGASEEGSSGSPMGWSYPSLYSSYDMDC